MRHTPVRLSGWLGGRWHAGWVVGCDDRYTNPVGRHQLEGLSEAQVGKWMKASSTDFHGLRAHEDEDNELGLFWY